MKKNVMMRMVMAIVIVFGVQATASAQLGGLLKRGKKIVKENIETTTNEVRTEVAEPAATTPTVPTTSTVNVTKVDITGAKKSDWTVTSPQSELVANVKYYAQEMQNSFDRGYKGLNYAAYNQVRLAYPSVVAVLKSTARSDYDNAVNEPVKLLDDVTYNFLKIATEGLPQYQDGEDKEAFIFRQLQFFMDRGQEFSDPEARAFFLDEVYSTLKIRTMETAKLHLNGNESGLSKVLSYLQSNRAAVPEQYKWRYPETFTFAAAKEQYNTPDYSTKRIAQLRAYKELEAQGKYGKMPASNNARLEKMALEDTRVHRPYFGKPIKAYVSGVQSTKKNALGVVITKYYTVKVLCEDQGYKVIHHFSYAENVKTGGSMLMTGFGWENGDKEIELVK